MSQFDAAIIEWHERRMAELRYPETIRDEFRRARKKWLAMVAKGRK